MRRPSSQTFSCVGNSIALVYQPLTMESWPPCPEKRPFVVSPHPHMHSCVTSPPLACLALNDPSVNVAHMNGNIGSGPKRTRELKQRKITSFLKGEYIFCCVAVHPSSVFKRHVLAGLRLHVSLGKGVSIRVKLRHGRRSTYCLDCGGSPRNYCRVSSGRCHCSCRRVGTCYCWSSLSCGAQIGNDGLCLFFRSFWSFSCLTDDAQEEQYPKDTEHGENYTAPLA